MVAALCAAPPDLVPDPDAQHELPALKKSRNDDNWRSNRAVRVMGNKLEKEKSKLTKFAHDVTALKKKVEFAAREVKHTNYSKYLESKSNREMYKNREGACSGPSNFARSAPFSTTGSL